MYYRCPTCHVYILFIDYSENINKISQYRRCSTYTSKKVECTFILNYIIKILQLGAKELLRERAKLRWEDKEERFGQQEWERIGEREQGIGEWRWVVETAGISDKEGKNQRLASVPASPRSSGIKSRTTQNTNNRLISINPIHNYNFGRSLSCYKMGMCNKDYI